MLVLVVPMKRSFLAVYLPGLWVLGSHCHDI